jgi:triphosphoribosyl-dephospho-CoA synthase
VSALAAGEIEGRVADALLKSCRLDVLAFKPGNVSVYSEGHGMTARDFLRSAELIAPIITAPGLSVGERVLRSVEVTRQAIGCNTNLGIVLLCAPLAHAALRLDSNKAGLRRRLEISLRSLDRHDAQSVFEAIRLAAPGGLGQSHQHDVRDMPEAGLIDAMEIAQGWDRIAYQYANRFEDIFELGLTCLREYPGQSPDDEETRERATIACYLKFLASFPDSHVQRKFGGEKAEAVRRTAQKVETEFKACENLVTAIPLLQEFDNKLKQGGVNPGTSADLTVASLFAFYLGPLHEVAASPAQKLMRQRAS